MSSKKRFQIVLEKDRNSQATFIFIPSDVQKEFCTRARVPVRGTINDFPFQSSIFPKGGGRYYMVVNRAMREGAKARFCRNLPFQVLFSILFAFSLHDSS